MSQKLDDVFEVVESSIPEGEKKAEAIEVVAIPLHEESTALYKVVTNQGKSIVGKSISDEDLESAIRYLTAASVNLKAGRLAKEVVQSELNQPLDPSHRA